MVALLQITLIGMQVISLCEKKRDAPLKYIIVDTPGQIEIFTWSASGAIITEAFASSFPTMIAFIIDTPRCAHPQTFMSNMLQASGDPGQAVDGSSMVVLPCESAGLIDCAVHLPCADRSVGDDLTAYGNL